MMRIIFFLLKHKGKITARMSFKERQWSIHEVIKVVGVSNCFFFAYVCDLRKKD